MRRIVDEMKAAFLFCLYQYHDQLVVCECTEKNAGATLGQVSDIGVYNLPQASSRVVAF